MNDSELVLRQGVPSGWVLPILDSNGDPADLSGYTAKCQVRSREVFSAPLLAELTATVVGSTVVVQWTAEQSLLWDWTSGYSDILLLDSQGVARQYLWQGMVRMDRAVTINV